MMRAFRFTSPHRLRAHLAVVTDRLPALTPRVRREENRMLGWLLVLLCTLVLVYQFVTPLLERELP